METLLERLDNESFVDGRVRFVDRRKRITTSRYELKVSSKGIVRTSLAKWNFVTCWIERNVESRRVGWTRKVYFDTRLFLNGFCRSKCFVRWNSFFRFFQLLKKSKSVNGGISISKNYTFHSFIINDNDNIFSLGREMLKKLSSYVWFKW